MGLDQFMVDKFRNARIAARKNLAKWAGDENTMWHRRSSAQLLARLLGFDEYFELQACRDPDVCSKMEALAGPHGYAVYKAMLARGKGDE